MIFAAREREDYPRGGARECGWQRDGGAAQGGYEYYGVNFHVIDLRR